MEDHLRIGDWTDEGPLRQNADLRLVSRSRLAGMRFVAKVGSLKDRERFERENAFLCELANDEQVVQVFDSGITDDGRPYIVTRWIDGGSLDEWMERLSPKYVRTGMERRHREAVIATLLCGVCRVLARVIERGILHLDLKTSNILISRVTSDPTPGIDRDHVKLGGGWRRAVLSDFGVSARRNWLREVRRTYGCSRPYAAPEAYCHGQVSEQSELYSLGATMYELLTADVPPPATENYDPAWYGKVGQELEGADPRLREIVLKCLAHDPRKRYACVGDLVAALKEFVGPPRKRSRVKAAIIAGVALASVVTLAVVVDSRFAMAKQSEATASVAQQIRDTREENRQLKAQIEELRNLIAVRVSGEQPSPAMKKWSTELRQRHAKRPIDLYPAEWELRDAVRLFGSFCDDVADELKTGKLSRQDVNAAFARLDLLRAAISAAKPEAKTYLDNTYAGMYIALGESRLGESAADFGKAIALCDEAVRADPENPAAFNNRAWAYYKLSETDPTSNPDAADRAVEDAGNALGVREQLSRKGGEKQVDRLDAYLGTAVAVRLNRILVSDTDAAKREADVAAAIGFLKRYQSALPPEDAAHGTLLRALRDKLERTRTTNRADLEAIRR